MISIMASETLLEDERGAPPSRHHRLKAAAGLLLALVVFGVAVGVLLRELSTIEPGHLAATLRAIPFSRLLLAFLLSALNYLILTGYDHLAFYSVGAHLPAWRIMIASFVGY